MGKYRILFIVLLNSFISYAQLAKIIDKDGYVNVREKGSINSKIIGKFNSGEIVQVFSVGNEESNWSGANGGQKHELAGLVYHNRLKDLSSFTRIPFVESDLESQFILDGSGFKVIVNIGDFNYKKNQSKFTSYKQEPSFLEKYNGQKMWGTEGYEPTRCYTSIRVIWKGVEIVFPKKAYESMFQPNGKELMSCYYDKEDDVLYLVGDNSDGSSSYTVLWVFKGGKYHYNNVYLFEDYYWYMLY